MDCLVIITFIIEIIVHLINLTLENDYLDVTYLVTPCIKNLFMIGYLVIIMLIM